MSHVRVRYAPSPTGHLHIGGARSALFNWLFARNQGGVFVVRFEDTDQGRNVPDAEAKQLRALEWLGIDWDEGVDVGGPYGPYRSMERLDLYRKEVARLIEQGDAYPCFCQEEELARERESQMARGETPRYSGKCRRLTEEQRKALVDQGREPSIRFRVPAGERLFINDLVRGEVRFLTDDMGDFVIVRPGGIPVYNLAVTVDDHLMAISHVIRGEEHLSNTPRQMLIYRALGWEPPHFAHVSLILNENRQKMSKRDESIIQFVEQYEELGYLPEAVMNFLALLGWSPGGEEEVFSAEELIRRFSLERVSKSPAVFDARKMAWLNNHYIKQMPLERILEITVPHLRKAGWIASPLDEEQRDWLNRLVALYQERLQYGAEIVRLTRPFFVHHLEYDEEALQLLKEEGSAQVLAAFLALWQEGEVWEEEEIRQMLKQVQQETGFKGKSLFMPIRGAVTGQLHGPDLPRTLALLGKDRVSERLRMALQA